MIPKDVSRRTVSRAGVWSVPVVAVSAPVAAFAASGPCARKFEVGSTQFSGGGNVFLGPSVATARLLPGSPAGAAVTVTFKDVSLWDTTPGNNPPGNDAAIPNADYHMSFGARADNANSGGNTTAANVGGSTNKGLILNLRGGSLVGQNNRDVRVTFSQEVQDLTFTVRDLSWHNATTGVREVVSFSVATSVTNDTNQSQSPGGAGALNVANGAVAANTPIYRQAQGPRPTGPYYDVVVTVPDRVTTFDVRFGRPVGTTSQDMAAVQLADFTFCASG